MLLGLANSKIELLIEVIRLGARSPNSKYFIGDNWASQYEPYHLTSTGIRQQYMLGQQILADYFDIFGKVKSMENIFVHCSANPHTYASAKAHTSGIFRYQQILFIDETDKRLQPAIKVDDDLIRVIGKAPIPGENELVNIWAFPVESNFILNMHSQCKPEKEAVAQLILESEVEKSKTDSFPQLIESIKKIGKLINLIPRLYELQDHKGLLYSCYKVADAATSDYYSNPNTKVDIKNPDYVNVKRCSMHYEVLRHKDLERLQLYGSSLLENIIDYMKNKHEYLVRKYSQPKQNEAEKIDVDNILFYQSPENYILYSGFDTTIMSVLSLIGLFDPKCIADEFIQNKDIEGCLDSIPYSSNVLLELDYDKKTSQSSVKVRFNGKYMSACGEGTFVENTCTLDNFIKNVSTKIKVDWASVCGLDSLKKRPNMYFLKIMMISSGALGLIMFGVVILFIMHKWRTVDKKLA